MAPKKPSGLGRGLGALLGDDVMKTESSGSLSLPISQVETCSSQPRKRFDDESLQELADSISQHGIIQPLTVRKLSSGYYQIIAGERRWRAARLAGLQEVPVIVIEADDRKAAELAMIENLQREDLNPMEEAAGFQSLIESYHMTQEEAAQRVGKSRSAVTNALRLLGLSPSVRKLVEENACIIDVREEQEFEAGHLVNAKNIPLSQLRERMNEIPRDRPVYLHCRSSQRSYNAIMALQGKGYRNLWNISGSFLGICLHEYFTDQTTMRKKIVTEYNFK